jgi:hypothetical protein
MNNKRAQANKKMGGKKRDDGNGDVEAHGVVSASQFCRTIQVNHEGGVFSLFRAR